MWATRGKRGRGRDREDHQMMELFAREVMPHIREDAHVDETAGVGR